MILDQISRFAFNGAVKRAAACSLPSDITFPVLLEAEIFGDIWAVFRDPLQFSQAQLDSSQAGSQWFRRCGLPTRGGLHLSARQCTLWPIDNWCARDSPFSARSSKCEDPSNHKISEETRGEEVSVIRRMKRTCATSKSSTAEITPSGQSLLMVRQRAQFRQLGNLREIETASGPIQPWPRRDESSITIEWKRSVFGSRAAVFQPF